MMLAVMEEEKAPAQVSQAKPAPFSPELKQYKGRRPKRAEILDLQETIRERVRKTNPTNQELVTLIKTWTELETLLQALDAAKVKGSGALPKSVAKSLSAVAEDDPAAGVQATDKPTS